ncbi:BolA family protein [Candidatus Pandoraea novymonadis]|uniref:DNA-binding transcriptional regulator BolA n=1 Tax=Candidatus Pandoraea novymonadis TaxID=1808959 RepID=A0ABX5FEP7_9BURK|nr:BolA family protein [Candidatus Pandoraea novymonadis]PSB92126.1 DNA-binding transcriptional regulator BolA [Candidatus Pandoraea novymonadis]
MSNIEDVIETRLRTTLRPIEFTLKNDSSRHTGHASAAAGGHYQIRIVSAAFIGQNHVERHRLVYDALADLMENGIHALVIKALSPNEG